MSECLVPPQIGVAEGLPVQERKTLQAQLERYKADAQAAADALAAKEAELAASSKLVHEQEDRLTKQHEETERLQVCCDLDLRDRRLEG